MNNLKEETLRLVVQRLQYKVETIMFKINVILSTPEKDMADLVENLLYDLSYTNCALDQAKNLYGQSAALRLSAEEELAKRMELLQKKITHSEPTHNNSDNTFSDEEE